ncbi:MAG TPA: hypothetical protein VI932_11970 [Bacteroidota bacterium]|nr:hypothetical protein [Bacteroidota bacterium]
MRTFFSIITFPFRFAFRVCACVLKTAALPAALVFISILIR